MATETVNRRASHIRSLKVTAIASIGGVIAGMLTPLIASSPTDTIAIAMVFAATLLELGFMRLVGVDVAEFSTKDNLYVTFMTFSLWFVTWTILLTTDASLV